VSTWKKSPARIVLACPARNARQVCLNRLSAGSMPASLSICHTVDGATLYKTGTPGRVPGHNCAGLRLGYQSSPSRGQQIWAGPVRFEPGANTHATRQHLASPPVAEFEDPPVILGVASHAGMVLAVVTPPWGEPGRGPQCGGSHANPA